MDAREVLEAVATEAIHKWPPDRLAEALLALDVTAADVDAVQTARTRRDLEKAVLALMRYPDSTMHEVAVALQYEILAEWQRATPILTASGNTRNCV